ncbi:MAG: DUF3891 family protein [Oscillatoria sp. PMC 1068.18]|nr:DUF3891 family protein [Oscillatoria sp. PMC 1076.18]MEC4991076.1 DUF3891 family protein [Oscillatoria sp. PMC 1068.18]
MLHSRQPDGLICITQNHHAWISGQLAQVWGNEIFGEFAPVREVCLAAEQHDIGWLNWEQNPTLNPQTGYPYRFSELPTAVHLEIWTSAKHLAAQFGRYVALLISLHGTRLYDRYRSWEKSPEASRLVQGFFQQESAFQAEMLASLTDDEFYAIDSQLEIIQRNQKLIRVWDGLSILFCEGFVGEQKIQEVPSFQGETSIKLTKTETKPNEVKISPWCFQQSEISLVMEGKLLQEKFTDETAMREALKSAKSVTRQLTLKPN